MTYIYKGIIVALLLFVAVMESNAQLPEKGDWKTRVGVKAPSMIESLTRKVLDNPPHATSTRNLTCKDYLDYYESFKKLTDYAPYAHYHFYSGDFSEAIRSDLGYRTIYECILDSITDEAMRVVIIDDFLALGRNMFEHLDSINVVRNNRNTDIKAVDDTLSLPVAMTKYAHLYYKYAGNPKYYPAHLYDKVQARENYAQAFKLMRENNINPGNEIEGIYVNEYYRTCEDLYKSNEEKYYEQFMQDYLDIVMSCDNLLNLYDAVPDSVKNNRSNTKYLQFQSYNYYTNHDKEGVNAMFKASGAVNHLNDYYMEQYDNHSKDKEYLNNAINILLKNDCGGTEAFFTYCEASYTIEPSFLNCFGCALLSKKYGMTQDMVHYFEEAYRLADNDLQRGIMAYNIGMAMNVARPIDPDTGKPYLKNTPQHEEWDKNTRTASSNLEKVLGLKEVLRNSTERKHRAYPADAAYGLAWYNYRLSPLLLNTDICDKAIQYAKFAMSESPERYNTNTLDLISKITDARRKIVEINKNSKAIAKQKKEYEEYMKKKKAEDDFWKQK